MARYVCYRYVQASLTANQYGIQLSSWSPWYEIAAFYNGSAACESTATNWLGWQYEC